MNEPITWTNDTRKLSELIPWEINPRQLTERQAEHLETSLRKFGYADPINISPDNEVYDGHQRRALMSIMQEYGQDVEIDVRVSSRPMTHDERKEFVIRKHENTGEWDYDTLPNVYDVEELGEWGFPEWKIDEFMPDEKPDENYSRKIEAPVYVPSGDKPTIDDLFDDSKTKDLIFEIEQAHIDEADKQFLRIAAQRHTVLSFDKIANYYAQSSADVQRLMENSALVIVDFDKAISKGFVKLTESIRQLVEDEYGNG